MFRMFLRNIHFIKHQSLFFSPPFSSMRNNLVWVDYYNNQKETATAWLSRRCTCITIRSRWVQVSSCEIVGTYFFFLGSSEFNSSTIFVKGQRVAGFTHDCSRVMFKLQSYLVVAYYRCSRHWDKNHRIPLVKRSEHMPWFENNLLNTCSTGSH